MGRLGGSANPGRRSRRRRTPFTRSAARNEYRPAQGERAISAAPSIPVEKG